MQSFALGVGFAGLVACGASSAPEQASTPVRQDAMVAATPSSPSLPVGPLSRAAILGEIAAEIVEIEPCPFLSDETALAGVSTTFAFARKYVSNDRCVWNYNIGFELSVSIEPSSDATPRGDRVYNLENPPVLEAQSGPGEDAVLFLDPTWDPNKPRPYAFAFSLDGKEVMVSTVGVKTSLTQLQAVSDEIAAQLPNALPIEPQSLKKIPAFRACDVWTAAEVQSAFPSTQGMSVEPQERGANGCEYTFYGDSEGVFKIQATFGKCSETFVAGRAAQGFTRVQKFDRPVSSNTKEEVWGTDYSLDLLEAPICVQFYSSQNRTPVRPDIQSGMETLMSNVMVRLPGQESGASN